MPLLVPVEVAPSPCPLGRLLPLLCAQKYNLLGCSDFVPLLSDPHGWRLPLADIVGLTSPPSLLWGVLGYPLGVSLLQRGEPQPLTLLSGCQEESSYFSPLITPFSRLTFPTYHPPFYSTFCTPSRKPGLLFSIVKTLLLTIKREERGLSHAHVEPTQIIQILTS